ncbi:hypothetical protein B0H17DRAFT_1333146 [Mycena rosella]|uniref:Uncharacterized protein n=1 Tax=Mycena rosella TaxID=1033263 RepID=A0AAD7D8T0_MYCRO|nr:hypothetical protein B0H17DRAFT_1333146 [Mycena rosella]
MAQSLPDDIISEILSPALKVPEEMFTDTADVSPFASRSAASSSAALLAQARALQAALRDNADLGRFIKMLRVEGGFGAPMHHILKQASEITDIFISLRIHSSDSTAGLVLGLPYINPTRLILDDEAVLMNKHVLGLLHSLKTCAEAWTNLTTISFPFPPIIDIGSRSTLFSALCARSSVKVVFFPVLLPDSIPFFLKIAQNPTLEAIEIKFKPARAVRVSLSDETRLVSLLRWPEKQKTSSRSKSIACVPANPKFQPMSSCPQSVVDRIWSRVLRFAMLPLETIESNRDQHYKRLRLLSVSKTFHRSGIPYLYRYLNFPQESSLHHLAARLTAAPALGAHIREMEIASYPFERSMGYPAVDLALLFCHTPRLTRLLGDGETRMSWAAVTALGNAAGDTLTELLGFEFHETGFKPESPAIFERFRALRSLAWDGGYRPILTSYFFIKTDLVPKGGLPALESLRLNSREALDVLAEMELPSLRRVSFQVRGGWGVPFLEKHGPKLEEMAVKDTKIGRRSVLEFCPRMTLLSPDLDPYDEDPFGLATLVLYKEVQSSKGKEQQDWARFFARLDLARFPALREVRVTACEWPKASAHAISKNAWVKLAETLLPRGVYLTDSAGTPWRPRLKVSRR